MSTPKEKLLAHLQKHGKDMGWAELSQQFNPGSSEDWARKTAKGAGVNLEAPALTIETQIENNRYKAEGDRHRRDKDHLLRQVIDLKRELELWKDLSGYQPILPFIPAPKDERRGEATAIIQWSDWHLDEEVKPQVVNGLNEFNKAVAEKRCAALFQNCIKLTDTQRSSVGIPNLVLQLGGDFIGNYLHPELEQTNTMGPMQAVEFAIEQLATGIDYLRTHGKFRHLTIVTNRGNHGRLTHKMQYNNDYALNLETIIYCMLKKEFKGERGMSWIINEGDLSYYEVYNQRLRFFHGHQVKFLGGIGGITIPLYKAIHRWNSTQKAFYNFMCDKHNYQNPTPNSQVNGSLKGFDAFANSRGFEYQEPLQSFTLLDSKRGITIKAPIFCK